MNAESIAGVTIASIMKLGHKVVELQFATQRPDTFNWRNGTCQKLRANSQATPSDHSVFAWIWGARYLLPVLGGALSVDGIGYIRVLQLGGFIMLLSSTLVSAAVYMGWMCSRPQFCLFLWLLLPLTFALVHPNAMHAIFRWHRPGSRGCTVVSAIYCGSAVLGECIGMLLPVFAGADIPVTGTVISVLFLWLSFSLREELEYSVPPMSRLLRYCRLFAALIVFVIAVSDCRPVVYIAEIRYLLQSLGNPPDASDWLKVWSPEVVKLISLAATCAGIAFLAGCLPVQRFPRRQRIRAGILLECSVSIGLIIVSFLQLPSATAVCALYTAASCLDGVATGVTMVAAYELMDAMSDRSAKPLVIGIVFTVLGLANILGRLVLALLRSVPTENPVLSPREGSRPLFYVYHLVILLLLLCLAYHWCFAFRLASTAVIEDDGGVEEERAQREAAERPLLGDSQHVCN